MENHWTPAVSQGPLAFEDSAARRAFEMMIRGCARKGDLRAARRWYAPWILGRLAL